MIEFSTEDLKTVPAMERLLRQFQSAVNGIANQLPEIDTLKKKIGDIQSSLGHQPSTPSGGSSGGPPSPPPPASGVSSVLSGSGITAAPATGIVTVTNTGVTSATGGTGISASPSTGSITITNTGVTSNVAGTGITVSGATGAVTITNAGVTSNIAGPGITVSGATGAVTISNGGVTSNIAGTGISVSSATGPSTITNTGVTSLVAGTGISVSGATGAVTVSATGSSGAMTQIADNTLLSDTAIVTFNSISGSYNHLQLIVNCRSTGGVSEDTVRVRFNNDSGSNYDNQIVYGTSSTAAAAAESANSKARMISCPGASASRGSSSGPNIAFIPNYAATTFEKTMSSTGGDPLLSGAATSFWRNTAAITRIDIFVDAGNLKTGSRFSLYGIT